MDCSICLERLEKNVGEEIELSCGHRYHAGVFYKWRKM